MASFKPSTPSSHPHARWATSTLFLVDGVGFGLWAALLPHLQTRLGLTTAQTSGPLLGMVIGAFLAMPLMGRAIGRWGSARSLQFVAPAYCAILPFLVLAPTLNSVIAVAVAFGALKGALDVGVNSQAITVETQWARPIMGSFQALWSFGGLIAASLISLALQRGAEPLIVSSTLSVVMFLAAWRAPQKLIDDTPNAENDQRRSPLSRPIVLIGLLAFAALFTEGVMMDWSAIYTQQIAHAPGWLAPLAYGAFCSAMATGRLLGDSIRARFNPAQMLRGSGLLATFGLVLIVAFPVWPVVFLGLVFSGFGIANLVPIFLSEVTRVSPHAVGRGVAAVSTIGYLGFMVGPPMVGGLSAHLGLRGALCGVIAWALAIAVLGPRMIAFRSFARSTASASRPSIITTVLKKT